MCDSSTKLCRDNSVDERSIFSTIAIRIAGVMASAIGGLANQCTCTLPFHQISSFVAIVLLIVFFVTSSDSGSLVIDSITAGGKLHAPVPQRIFWATMEGLIAIVLLVGGGSAALSSLQAGAITAGLPFTVVLLACCVSLLRGLREELTG